MLKTFKYIINYPVLLNKWLSWSHLSMWKQPGEKPKRPSFFFLKFGQLLIAPILYTTWSCNEPPILRRREPNSACKFHNIQYYLLKFIHINNWIWTYISFSRPHTFHGIGKNLVAQILEGSKKYFYEYMHTYMMITYGVVNTIYIWNWLYGTLNIDTRLKMPAFPHGHWL